VKLTKEQTLKSVCKNVTAHLCLARCSAYLYSSDGRNPSAVPLFFPQRPLKVRLAKSGAAGICFAARACGIRVTQLNTFGSRSAQIMSERERDGAQSKSSDTKEQQVGNTHTHYVYVPAASFAIYNSSNFAP